MKKTLCALTLSAMTLTACAGFTASDISVKELSSHSWMSDVKVNESCEIPPLITFTADGKISGEPGCNNLIGEYKIGKNGEFRFENLGLTRKLCAKPYMQQERAFMAMIEATRFAEKDGDKIVFLNQDKKPLGAIVPEKAGACL